jgi:hypothetical protein
LDELICRSCQHPVEAGDLICGTCNANLTASGAVVPAVTDPAPADETRLMANVAPDSIAVPPARTGPDDELHCPHCAAVLPDPAAALCPTCLRPRHRHVTVALVSPAWRYVVAAGTRLVLGRDPAHSPAAAVLAAFDTVSRQHAEVAVDRLGAVTVTDLGSTNGTYLDGERLAPGAARRLAADAILRLASGATFRVTTSRGE